MGQGDPDAWQNELGDVAWYHAALASKQGLQLADVLQGNVDKLIERYPDGFNSEDSIKRVDVNGHLGGGDE